MTIDVRRLTPDLEPDFWTVHADDPWCACAAWAVPTWEGWGQRTARQNRAVRDELFREGLNDGYLLYVDGEPAGWCQVVPLGRFPKLDAVVAGAGTRGDPVIGCFRVRPAFRKRGLAHALLRGILDDLRRQSVGRVWALPRRGEHLADGEVWTGPEAVFRRAGFPAPRTGDERGPVVLLL